MHAKIIQPDADSVLFLTDSTSFNRYTECSDVSCPCGYMRYVPHSRLLLFGIQLRGQFVGVLIVSLLFGTVFK